MLTKYKNTQLHTVISRAGLTATRHKLYAGFGCQRSEDLTYEQAELLLAYLDRQRKAFTSAILKRLNLLGIGLVNPFTGQTDWGSVNRFLAQPRLIITKRDKYGMDVAKTLYDMTFDELNTTHKRVCSIHDFYLKKKQKERRLAANN